MEFVGLGFGEVLRYQFKLEGWTRIGRRLLISATSSTRNCRREDTAFWFALLQPMSSEPSTGGHEFHRARASMAAMVVPHCGGLRHRPADFRHIRSRVAHLAGTRAHADAHCTDLHDDIGSSLSQIAIQSEVLRRRIADQDPRTQQRLSQIAETSRGLVDAMGEIVWAMQPGHDGVDDLTTRMRHFAANIFTAREIDFEFNSVAPSGHLKLDGAPAARFFSFSRKR